MAVRRASPGPTASPRNGRLIPRLRNQLSYTSACVGMPRSWDQALAAGDVALNYRYQLVATATPRVAVAPRLQRVCLPFGRLQILAVASAAMGFQTNWAMSVVREQEADHSLGNAGASGLCRTAKDRQWRSGQDLCLQSWPTAWCGPSAILASTRLLETCLCPRGKHRRPESHREWDSQLLLNPGIRWAYNFSNGLADCSWNFHAGSEWGRAAEKEAFSFI